MSQQSNRECCLSVCLSLFSAACVIFLFPRHISSTAQIRVQRTGSNSPLCLADYRSAGHVLLRGSRTMGTGALLYHDPYVPDTEPVYRTERSEPLRAQPQPLCASLIRYIMEYIMHGWDGTICERNELFFGYGLHTWARGHMQAQRAILPG